MAESTFHEPVESVSPGSAWQLAKYALIAILFFVLLLACLGWATARLTDRETASSAVDAATGTITLALTSEPPQLDSTRATDMVSGMLLGHVMEGLFRYNPDNELVPGMCESWEMGELGGYFNIRRDAKWSNGAPVTAHDFVFAWRTAVDPATASQYAFILFSIKNAKEINEGKLPVEALGATAIDDHTLQVELSRPTPYFLKLLAFPTYFPINEQFYRSTEGRYGANAEDLIYNGPFEMTHWAHDANLRLDKNEIYWNKDSVRLQTIDFAHILSDANSLLNLYETNKIATTSLNAENIERALNRKWFIKQNVSGSVYFLEINHRPERLTSNLNLRRALQAVNDPAELVYKVLKIPGNIPGESIIPRWIKGVEGTFREEYPAPTHVPNEEKARKYLAAALDEMGLDTLPPLVLLSGDSEVSNKISEYIQNVYKEKLGIELILDRQIFKQRLAKMTAGDFDIVAAGWGPDYDDILTFGDLFASWNENNRGRYESDEFDAAVAVAQSSSDPRTRMDAMAKVQQLIYEDVVVLPQYESGSVYVADQRIKGISRRAVGTDPDYTQAYIADESES